VTRGPKNKATQHRRHQRRIRISVVVPVSVELLVGTDDEDPDKDSDWEILEARDPRCEVSRRVVEENMHDEDCAALVAAAASAEDEP
jgi:hypothetical protein